MHGLALVVVLHRSLCFWLCKLAFCFSDASSFTAYFAFERTEYFQNVQILASAPVGEFLILRCLLNYGSIQAMLLLDMYAYASLIK